MRRRLSLLPVLLSAVLAACAATPKPDYGRALPLGSRALLPLAPGEPRPDVTHQWYHRRDIVSALDKSLAWMDKPSSKQHFPVEGIDHDKAKRSLARFKELLEKSRTADEFARGLQQEFDVYRSAGWDGRGGGVLFTAYCTPVLQGSRDRSAIYRYPLYGLPDDLVKGENGEILGQRSASGTLRPYPTRRSIETLGLLEGRGLELVWLKDPVDAFIAHVNGSAVIRLAEGGELRLGYAGKNGRTYRSLRNALVAAGAIDPLTGNLASIREWARRTPVEKVLRTLHENDSYVFFTEITGTPHGSLNVPVTAERTLATDKSLFPRGAIVLVDASLPDLDRGQRPFRQFLFDQDTGGAIRTAGRADIYLGVGDDAERLAGRTQSEGQMYYYFLKR